MITCDVKSKYVHGSQKKIEPLNLITLDWVQVYKTTKKGKGLTVIDV